MVKLLFLFLISGSLVASSFSSTDLSSLFGGMSSSSGSGKLADAGGYFSVSPPKGFKCSKGAGRVECAYKGHISKKSKSTVEAKFSFNVFTVPESATVALVNLNQKDKYIKKIHFSEAYSGKAKIGGIKASNVVYTFDELGDVNLPRWVQTIQGIKSGKLYQIKLNCLGRTCSEYRKTMDALARDFKIAALDKSGLPVSASMASEIGSAQAGSLGGSQNVNATLESIFKELD